MRVLFLTHHYFPIYTGATWTVYEHAVGLAARGHEVTIATGLCGAPAENAGNKNPRILRFAGHLALPELVSNADVVVAQLRWAPMAIVAARENDIPVVVLCHTETCAGRANGADLMVFPTRASVPGEAGQHLVLSPPIDRNRLVHGEASAGNNIAMVNLAAHKGGSVFWELARRFPERDFLAVQGGSNTQIRGHLPNVVIRTPTVVMSEVYGAARVLLFPSLYETFGRAGVEAQMAGVPVIASDLPALRESLGEGALFIPPKSIEGWVDALMMLDDPGRYARLTTLAVTNASRYDRDAIVAKFETVLVDLVKRLGKKNVTAPLPVIATDDSLLCTTGAPGQNAFAAALVCELGFRAIDLKDLEPWLWSGKPVLVNGWWPDFEHYVHRYPGLIHVVWHSGWTGSDLMGEAKLLEAALDHLKAGRIKMFWLDRRDVPPPGAKHLTPIWSPSWLDRVRGERPAKCPGAVMAGLHGQFPTPPKNLLTTVIGAVESGAEVHLGRSTLSGKLGTILEGVLHDRPHVVHETLSREELLPLLASMEVLVHPSLSETWPVMCLEAIYLGTPVITSDATAWTVELDPEVAALCVVRPPTATQQIAEKVRHLLDHSEDRERVLAEQQRVLDTLFPAHLEAIMSELKEAGFPVQGRRDDVTVFVITTGEPSTAECLTDLARQDMHFRVDVIENVAPIWRAFQQMLDRCETPYFVQVDADMLFPRSDAIRTLYERLRAQPEHISFWCDWLWDESVGRAIQGVKIYRHDICRRFPYREGSLSCEQTQYAEMAKGGHPHAFAPPPRTVDACLGIHHGCQTPRLAYLRWKSLGQKHANLPNTMGWLADHFPDLLQRALAAPTPINVASLAGAFAGLGNPDVPEKERDFREVDRGFDFIWKYFGSGVEPDRYDKGATDILSAARAAEETRIANLPVVDEPKELILYLTGKCPHKCPFCFRQQKGKVRGLDWIAPNEEEPRFDMEPALVRNVLKTFPSLQSACLAGFGEPLCHPQLGEIVEILYQAAIQIGLITNGSLLWNRREEVERWPLAYLSVSMNAVDEAGHREAAGVGTWEAILQGLRYFAASPMRVGISFVVHRGNAKDVPRFIAFARELGLRFVHLVNLLPHGDPDDRWFRDHVLTVDCPEAAEIESYKVLPGAEIVEVWPVPLDLNAPPPRKCQSPWTSIGVNSWGHTSLCRRIEDPTVYRGDHFQTEGTWRNDQNTKLRQAMLGKVPLPRRCTRCFGCWSQ